MQTFPCFKQQIIQHFLLLAKIALQVKMYTGENSKQVLQLPKRFRCEMLFHVIITFCDYRISVSSLQQPQICKVLPHPMSLEIKRLPYSLTCLLGPLTQYTFDFRISSRRTQYLFDLLTQYTRNTKLENQTQFTYLLCMLIAHSLSDLYVFTRMPSKTHLTLFVSVIFAEFYIILSPLTSVASHNVNVTQHNCY